jgi:hypothetical protein
MAISEIRGVLAARHSDLAVSGSQQTSLSAKGSQQAESPVKGESRPVRAPGGKPL